MYFGNTKIHNPPPYSIKYILSALFIISIFNEIMAGDSLLWREEISLIPYPQKVKISGENFIFKDITFICLDKNATDSDRFTAQDLTARLKDEWDIETNITSQFTGSCIRSRSK